MSEKDGVVDRLPAIVEERVRVPLATNEAHDLAAVTDERSADAQVGRLVHVCVARADVDAVEQLGDRAERGALAGLVATGVDVHDGRGEIEGETAARSARE